MTTWRIGESGTTVALDGTGKGEVTFTVTNAGAAADRAVLTITPLDGAAETWFAVPEPQRAVDAGASAVYPVGVSVPAATAAGTYGMQGVAYSADTDPSESSATSKRVSLTVPPRPDGGVPAWVWLVVAAVVLLVVGVIVFLVTRGGEDDPGDPTTDPTTTETTPPLTAEPTIGGRAELGRTLTADPGTFSPDPDAIALRWLRCAPDGEGCVSIDGAVSDEYDVVGADVDHALRVEVTATRGNDETTVRSGPTPAIPGLTVSLPPQISGNVQVGQTLTTTTGSWSPPEAVLAVQWQRCNPGLTACSPIPSQTAQSYIVQAADIGGALRAEIRASLAGATAVAHTQATGTVAAPDVEVPNVVGDSPAQAISRLENAGLQAVVSSFPSNNCETDVRSQNPASGTFVRPGTSVTIRVPFFDPPNENAECP